MSAKAICVLQTILSVSRFKRVLGAFLMIGSVTSMALPAQSAPIGWTASLVGDFHYSDSGDNDFYRFTGVNDKGQLIGQILDDFYPSGTTFGPSGGLSGDPFYPPTPVAINASGQVVLNQFNAGSSTVTAKIWDKTTPTPRDLFGPPSTLNTYSSDINDLGQVSGRAYSSLGSTSIIRWDNETPTVLETPNGWRPHDAGAINSGGYVVGSAVDANGKSQGIVWDPSGKPTPLQRPVFGDSIKALYINDAGEILGYYEGPKGRRPGVWGTDGTFKFTVPAMFGQTATLKGIDVFGNIYGTQCAQFGCRPIFVDRDSLKAFNVLHYITPPGLEFVGPFASVSRCGRTARAVGMSNNGRILVVAGCSFPEIGVSGTFLLNPILPPPNKIPEPASPAILLAGLLALFGSHKIRRQA